MNSTKLDLMNGDLQVHAQNIVPLGVFFLRPNLAKMSGGSLKVVYLQCYFVTIATILGTGILGLPVTLAHSGLYPFLITFLIGYFVQVLLIWLFTDVLQRAHAIQLKAAHENESENVPLKDMEDEEDFDSIEDEHEDSGPIMAGHIIIPKDHHVKPPNLHLMGELFLPCGLRQLFDLVLLIQFIALLISYALAGSEAFAAIIGIDHFYVIPVFVWVLTFAVVFCLRVIQPIVALLTFAKASLLLGTVVVTFFVGTSINHNITTDFSYTGAPFLMGTVALGGIVNVMPFLYEKIQPIRSQVTGFRNSVILGLTSCMILNVLWCWAVLDIVPQMNSCFVYQVKHNNSLHTLPSDPQAQPKQVCAHNLSLETSSQNGEISTIPLTQIINQLYPGYNWVAYLVETFIMISITVSFLTIGAAMHHTLSGWVESIVSQERLNSYSSKLKSAKKTKCCSSQCVCQAGLSLLAFTAVFVVAMLNPKGFESMLEKAASLFINLEAGIFVFIMVFAANRGDNRQLLVPCPVSSRVLALQLLLPLYFGFAVLYDIFTSSYAMTHHGRPLPWEHNHAIGVIFPIDEEVYFNSTLADSMGKAATTTVSPLLNGTTSYIHNLYTPVAFTTYNNITDL